MEAGRGKGLFLLVVEKDPEFVHLIRKSLEENSHYTFRVDQVSEFDAAIKRLHENHYHLLLVENRLKDGRGLDLLEKLRGEEINIPFVLMTDVRDDQLALDATREGVADLIIKSESQFQELAAKLELSYEKYCDKRRTFSSFNATETLSQDRRKIAQMREEKKRREMQELRHRDELTGMYNHSYLHERLIYEFSAAARYEYPLSCLFIDIDQFRRINEKYSFQTGDSVLRRCAELLFENCRMSDVIARYGGEEFVLLLPHTPYEGALNLAARMQKKFLECDFSGNGSGITVPVSIGISSYPEDRIQKRFELLSFATQAALRSKVAGGNKISRYKDVAPVLGEDLLKLKLSEERIDAFRRRMSEISDAARRAYLEASRMLISALEEKDQWTAGHSESAAQYAAETAKALGMTEEEAEVVSHAALLHDIGKLCIPDEILMKKAKLTFQEYETMKQHPYLGYQILKPIKFLQQEALLVLHHHEWFNGMGYPAGLQGKKIPLGSRIIAVLDSFDTLHSSGGRYKATCSVKDSINELIAYAGSQFDPAVVKAFIEVLNNHGQLTDAFNRGELEEKLKVFPPAA